MVGKTVDSLLNLKMFKNMGALELGGHAMNIGMGVMTYKEAKREGDTTLTAGAKAVSDMVMMDIVGMPAYLGAQALSAIPSAAVGIYEGLGKLSRTMAKSSLNRPFNNATFADSQQAYTMRQAGMKMAQASRYNLQQAILGNEAQYMHL